MESIVASRIRDAQANAGLTNQQLAYALEISERLLGKWRSGENTPTMKNLIRLGRVLDRPVAWFFSDDEAAA